MTLAEARALQPGDYIASPDDSWYVRRVTDRWTSISGAFVRVKLASYRQGEWIDPRGFAVCPRNRTDAFPYRQGDTLRPEHRPSQIHKDEQLSTENAISGVENSGEQG